MTAAVDNTPTRPDLLPVFLAPPEPAPPVYVEDVIDDLRGSRYALAGGR